MSEEPEWKEDKLIHPLLHCKGRMDWEGTD